MTTVLFKHERIVTTHSKALEVRKSAEKMITRAKEDTVHNRRIIARDIQDEAMLAKLFKEIGPRMKDRNGGYTRILRIGARAHDNADMVILELVDHKDDGKQAERDKRKEEKKAKAKAKVEAAEAAEKTKA
jgi:large subunit ribosomal protein L17